MKYDTEEEVSTNDEHQDCVVVFDDTLEVNQEDISPFFTRVNYGNKDVYCVSQRYFEILLLSINNCKVINSFKRTAKIIQDSLNDKVGFDMSYEEFEQLFKKAWKEIYTYIEIFRLDDEERYCICNESKKERGVIEPGIDLF